jgi:hypothetical protein
MIMEYEMFLYAVFQEGYDAARRGADRNDHPNYDDDAVGAWQDGYDGYFNDPWNHNSMDY